MAKQDVLDAINATIIENGQKGITADSLRNLLTMMVENTGEGSGSGDGALRVIVPDMMMLGPEIISIGELSPASWEEMKPFFEQSGLDPSEYDAVVKASFEHNANVAQQIIEKAKAGQGTSVVLDQTPYLRASINLMLQTEPEMADMLEEVSAFAVQPAGFFMQYLNATPESEAITGGDIFECMLVPAGNINIDGWSATYPSNMLIYLNLDGSLTFTQIEEEQPSSGNGVVTFYMPSGETITDEEKAKNKAAFETYVGAEDKPLVKVCNGGSDLLSIMTLFNDGAIVAMTSMGEYSITSQGDITMSVNS